MGLFEDDSFDDFVKEFFGQQGVQRKVQTREDDRLVDFIDTDERLFLIVELPGFTKEEVNVTVRDKVLEIKAQKRELEGLPEYLAQRLMQGIKIRRTLPSTVNVKSMSYTFSNGILEVSFKV
jgi:HSP20 family protein